MSIYFARARGSQTEQLGFSGAGAITTVTSGATAGSFGTAVSLGTTGFAYDSINLMIGCNSQRRGAIKVTANTGGGDELIIDSIGYNSEASGNIFVSYYELPLRIPSGANIKVQAASETVGSSTFRAAITGRRSGALLRGFSRIISCTDFSGTSDPTNLITLNGTTLTGWVTVQASTTATIGKLWAVPICTNQTMGLGTSGQIFIEIGFGAAASEISLFKVPLVANNSFNNDQFGIECEIPAGTRIAARAQANTATSSTIGVVCHGGAP